MTNSESRPQIKVFTDGACSGNPGPGGYGVILEDENGNRRELSEGFRNTTNNRMELRGVIEALEALKVSCDVKLYCDSQYVVKAIEEHWLKNWIKRGWKKADKSAVMNVDLWRRLLPLLETHSVKFIWTRGHAGHAENERCDELAVAASRSGDLKEDRA
ncbi:MAG: ribonuclease HI [Bacteroidota bacterium]|nr:ribonuclease HI [Bacteroidota bacterium]MDP4230487.1 ribonuclease HI [Bacteroidota bacterium]MDP4237297.1 ribonuclease HI [Bacteroidota bacterium]